MKKIIIGLLLVLVLLVVSMTLIVSTSFDLYKAQEQTASSDVLEDSVNTGASTVYYYYSPTCAHCSDIKPAVTSFAKIVNERDDVNLKLIDTTLDGNGSALAAEGTFSTDPSEMKESDDIKFMGTPGAVYVVDGVVVDYQTGSGIFEILNQAKSDFNLEVEFDESVYRYVG